MVKILRKILVAMLMKMSFTIEMKDCNLKYSDFRLVRKVTCDYEWFAAGDFLYGTEAAYGALGVDCQYNIPFSTEVYDDMLFTSVDLLMWQVYKKNVIEKCIAT